jgi:hypothetical protein
MIARMRRPDGQPRFVALAADQLEAPRDRLVGLCDLKTGH